MMIVFGLYVCIYNPHLYDLGNEDEMKRNTRETEKMTKILSCDFNFVEVNRD